MSRAPAEESRPGQSLSCFRLFPLPHGQQAMTLRKTTTNGSLEMWSQRSYGEITIAHQRASKIHTTLKTAAGGRG